MCVNSNFCWYFIKLELEWNLFWFLRSWILNLELYMVVNIVLYLVEKKIKLKKNLKDFIECW